MNYWLMKTEPETFGWDDLIRDGKTTWDGVRNFAARNHMASMKKGDQVFIYHSVIGKAVVGIAEVTKESYPDKTSDDPRWVVVDLKPVKPLKNPVTLEQIKSDKRLQEMPLVRIGRLSVSPVTKKEWDTILQLSNNA